MKKTYLYSLAAAGIVLLGIFSGCVNLRRDYPVRQFYVLDAKPDQIHPPSEDGPIVQIQVFQASPGSATTEFVYRTGESTFESDPYNAFFTLPANQIRALTMLWLQDSGKAQAVLNRSSRLRPTNIVEGNLVELYGDFRDKENPRAVISLAFLLMDIVPITPRIVFSKTYRESIAIPESTGDALVNGWNEGLTKILTSFNRDLPVETEESRLTKEEETLEQTENPVSTLQK
jgi:cholesterol transport system auxiliary component